MNKIQFRSRKEVSEFLKTKGIDTSNWSEVKWLSINKGQAEIHMMALAEAMWDARQSSTPMELVSGQWHIPYGPTYTELKEAGLLDNTSVEQVSLKIATARAAQTSYTVVGEDGKPTSYEKLIALHDRLVNAGHWSCFEHCAIAKGDDQFYGNFKGWLQYRKMFPNENKEVGDGSTKTQPE